MLDAVATSPLPAALQQQLPLLASTASRVPLLQHAIWQPEWLAVSFSAVSS
jgi:hypothetical protein